MKKKERFILAIVEAVLGGLWYLSVVVNPTHLGTSAAEFLLLYVIVSRSGSCLGNKRQKCALLLPFFLCAIYWVASAILDWPGLRLTETGMFLCAMLAVCPFLRNRQKDAR